MSALAGALMTVASMPCGMIDTGGEPTSSEMPRLMGVTVVEGDAGSSGLDFSVESSSVG